MRRVSPWTLIDIGVNLADKAFHSDLDGVCERAAAAGVRGMVLTGTRVAESSRAADLAARLPGAWSTAGVHPHYARECDHETVHALRELANRDEVVAVGECGLDYFRDLSPRETQREWLEKQLALASELRMPVFLHDREAHDDLLAIVREHRDTIPRAVVH